MNDKEYVHNSETAILILHEIYGLNQYMDKVCNYYFNKGYDIYCPDLLNRVAPFDYTESEEAYHYFISSIGFSIYQKVIEMIDQLKKKYKKVILVGFSIGATISWICASNIKCDGMIGYYGSRIRDYLELNPLCPTLLLFARDDTFDVDKVSVMLKDKEKVIVGILEGKHGFLDDYSDRYHHLSAEKVMKITDQFLSDITRG